MDAIERIGLTGLVPVVVIERAGDAEETARALLKAGIDVMEITMRTAAGLDAIRAVRQAYPEMLVGAGTVLSVEKAKAAAEAGAQFIVAPGFNPDVVEWCIQNEMPVTPGCVTPTEIEKALSFGLKTLKFFPADVYGGVKGCKALYGPYKSEAVKFIPTGGVGLTNLHEYVNHPFIHAVGGGFLCKTEDISAHNFDAITHTAQKAVEILLGFEFDHLGINEDSEEKSLKTAGLFAEVFGFDTRYGTSSNFAGPSLEITKTKGLGANGHIAVRTNRLPRAIHYLERRGIEVDPETAKYKGNKMKAIYLKEEYSGFAVHLLEK